MKIVIKHETRGRMRVSMPRKFYTFEEADMLQYYLLNVKGIEKVIVYERSADAVIYYTCDREEVLQKFLEFNTTDEDIKALVPEQTGRELMAYYKEKLIMDVVTHYAMRLVFSTIVEY